MKKIFLIAICLVSFSAVFGQEKIENTITDAHVNIPSSKVSLIPPAGYTKSTLISGFQNLATGSSIVFIDLPAPYSKIAPAFNRENLISKGIEFLSKEEYIINGLPAILINAQQSISGSMYSKKLLILGNETESIMIQGVCNNLNKAEIETIKTTLLAIVYDAEKEINPFDNIGYTLDVSAANLQFANSMMSGFSMTYTTDGKEPTASEDKTTLIVTKSVSKLPVEDKKGFALKNFKNYPLGLEEIESINEIMIDGIPGYEIFAKCLNNEELSRVYHVILFGDQINYLFMGQTFEKKKIKKLKSAISTFSRI